MEQLRGEVTRFLVGERLGKGGQDFKSTVAWRKPVKLSGKWEGEFHWEDLVAPGKGWGLPMATGGTICRRVIAQSQKAQAKSTTHLVPVD